MRGAITLTGERIHSSNYAAPTNFCPWANLRNSALRIRGCVGRGGWQRGRKGVAEEAEAVADHFLGSPRVFLARTPQTVTDGRVHMRGKTYKHRGDRDVPFSRPGVRMQPRGLFVKRIFSGEHAEQRVLRGWINS